MKLKTLAPLLAVGAAVCWGVTGFFVRPLYDAGLTSVQAVEARCASTAVLYLAFMLTTDREALRIRLKDLWCFIGTGIASVLFFNVCYYTTIAMTSLSVAAVLLYTAPAFVLVLSRLFFGEQITRRKALAVVLTIVGCFFVSGILSNSPSITGLGVLIGIGSGLGYALYSIFSRFALERGYKPLVITTWTFIFAGIGGAFVGDVPSTIASFSAQPSALWALLGVAVVTTVMPYMLYTTALTYMENGRAAVIVSIEPVIATILGVSWFGESFTWDNAIGIVLVLVAIALLNLGGQAASQKEEGS